MKAERSNIRSARNSKHLSARQAESGKEVKILNEIQEKRQRNIKYFFKNDGTYEAAIYPSPVHYLSDGKYKDIDNNLVDATDELGNAIFENRDNDYKVRISKNTKSKKLVRVIKDKYELSWNIKGIADTSPSVVQWDTKFLSSLPQNDRIKILTRVESAVDLKSILPGIDVKYQIKSTQFKENIIINQKIQNPQFIYNLYVNNLGAKLLSDRTIVFYDEKDEAKEIFIMRIPFMIDSKQNESRDISVSLAKSVDGYIMTITPDNEWLNNSDTVYPITIDPYIQTSLDPADIFDNHVSSNLSDTNFIDSILIKAGYGSASGHNRTFIKFKLPNLTAAETIFSANLSLYLTEADTFNSQIDVHRVIGSWETDKITWNNKPQYDESKIEEYQIMSDAKFYNFDITGIVKDWYNSGTNNGFMLKRHVETSSAYNVDQFCSSDTSYSNLRPQITIMYVNNSGLEGYWTYHSQDVGRAGTGHVNDYTGNLVFIHNDLSMNGNRMPVTINHVYNSNDKDITIGYGYGWRLNLTQTVKWESIGGVDYFTHTDEDGTKHYYKYDSEKGYYVDDAGTDFSLTISGSGPSMIHTIKDKSGNKLNFDYNGYLKSIEDKNGNKITLTYDANDKLIKVEDGAGRATILNYNEWGYLLDITDPAGRRTDYRYTGAQLTTITYTYDDSKVTTYTYDGINNLTSAENYDGYKINYSYYDTKESGNVLAYRIRQIQETHRDGTLGGELNITYSKNSTTFTDINGRQNIYQFNNIGNTISIKDADGSAQHYRYDDVTNKNKLSLESKLQKTVINLLKNHNMESDSDWTAGSLEGSTGSGSYDTSTKNMGDRSLKVVKTNNLGRQYFSQGVTLEKGKTYTLSGYVRTNNVTIESGKGAVIYATYAPSGGGNWPYIDSQYVNGTNDWQRVEVTFTFPNDALNNTVYIGAGIYGVEGEAYFDNLQLEEGSIANRYNLVENSSFEYGSGTPSPWEGSFIPPQDGASEEASIFGTQSIKMIGDANINKWIRQRINISGNKGDTFVVSGWAKGNSIPLTPESRRYFALDLEISRTDVTTPQYGVVSFNDGVQDWQYASDRIIADGPYDGITIYAIYYKNANTAYFDGIQVYREEFGTSFSYDKNGNVVSIVDLANQTSTFKYNQNNDLVNAIDLKGNNFEYVYDDKRNIKSATSAENVVYSFSYDSYGNPITAKVGDSTLFIESKSAYNTGVNYQNGNYVSTVTDPMENKVTYNYNETKGTLDSVEDPKGKITSYGYDSNDRLVNVSKVAGGKTITNSYSYENDRIKKVTHNGFSYTFGYDSLGNNTAVDVGDKNLITNEYEKSTGNLLESIYGNGQRINTSYDILDRVSAMYFNGNMRYWYEYDAAGNLGYHDDIANGIKYRYVYDLSNRLSRVKDNKGNITSFGYDLNNNGNKLAENLNGAGYITSHVYSRDNRPLHSVYNRYLYNDGRIEYFPLNVDAEGTKGAKPVSFNAGFDRDKEYRQNLMAYEGSTNLIPKNSSFEGDIADWNAGDWNTGGTGRWRLVNDGVAGGKSIECYDSDNKTDGSVTNSVAFQDIILTTALAASQTYTISAYAKRIGETQPAFSILCYDSNGVQIPDAYWTYGKNIEENQWVRISQSFTAPVGTKMLQAVIRSAVKDRDIVRFDNVQVEQKPFATPYTATTSTAAKVLYNLGVNKKSGTMGVWFYTTVINTVRMIISSEGTTGQIFNMYLDADNKLKLNVRNNAGNISILASSSDTIAPDTWYFAAYKWQLSGFTLNATLYLNGNVIATGSTSEFKDFTGGTTSIGSTIFGYSQINGAMQQFMYSDSDLTDTEINNIYSHGRGNDINNRYDALGRLIEKDVNTGISTYSTTYSYLNNPTTGSSSTLLSAISNNNIPISYAYDKNGNISKITMQGGITIDYAYDELNELIREDNKVLNKTIVYSYDVGGNILSKTEYSYTVPDVTPTVQIGSPIIYSYGDSNWKDKLTQYGSKPITYDDIGNVTSYDGWTFIWDMGRQLASITKGAQTTNFIYNDSGIRIGKDIVNGVSTKYHLVGDKVTFETNGTDNIYYTYDNSDKLVSMNLNGIEYYYIRNGQGDIIGLFDKNGIQVVTYSYGTWGNIISINDSSGNNVGQKNPYRYRGYRYDSETGLYYLQSRYYNPEWGRFINADDDIIGNFRELLNHNMFIYCNNNPINREDPNGTQWLRSLREFVTSVFVVAVALMILPVINITSTLNPTVGTKIQTKPKEKTYSRAVPQSIPVGRTKKDKKPTAIYR